MRTASALILAMAVASVAMAAPVVRRVTGTVERAMHAQGPCGGGAAISNERMQEWAAKTRRFPLAKTTFTVFAGDKRAGKPVMRFKTDRAGRFEVRLPEGVFCVMAGEPAEVAPEVSKEPQTPPAATSGNVDQQCLRDRALACDVRLYVRSDNPRDVKLTLDTFAQCPEPWAQPCYRGPMPP